MSKRIPNNFPKTMFGAVGDSDCGQEMPFTYSDVAEAIGEAIPDSGTTDDGYRTVAEYKLVRVFRAKVVKTTSIVKE